MIGLFFDKGIYYNQSEKKFRVSFFCVLYTKHVDGTVCVLCIVVQRIISAYEKN